MPELPPLATQVRGLSLPERLTRAIEELQQFLRVRGGLLPGENLDAYISRRDLVQWGFATSDLAVGGAPGAGAGPIIPVTGGTGNEPDYTPPPVPENVTAIGGYTSVFVKWAPVVDRRIGYFEVWRAAVDDVGEAVKIGQTTSFLYIDEVQNSDSFFYWVRSVNAWDDSVTSAFNAVAGTAAQTAPDVGYAIEVLTGALGEQPFFEITEPTEIGGIVFDPGVYIKDLFVKKAIAEVFVAGLAVIDDASIKNVMAGKILADKLGVGQYLESQNYVAGSTGWRINADGNAEYSNIVARGTVYASAGAIGGIQIGATFLRSTGFIADTTGFQLNTDGTVEFNDATVRGHIEADTGYFAGTLTAASGTYTGSVYSGSYGPTWVGWPAVNSGGFHLSGSGLFLGTWNGLTGTYAYVLSDGTANFSNIRARGDIEATSLKADTANIVQTLHVAGNAITVPNGAKLTTSIGDGWGAYITLPDLVTDKPVLVWCSCGTTDFGLGGKPANATLRFYYYNGGYIQQDSVSRPVAAGMTGDNPNTSDTGLPTSLFTVFWPPSAGSWLLRVAVDASNFGGTATAIAAIQGKR